MYVLTYCLAVFKGKVGVVCRTKGGKTGKLAVTVYVSFGKTPCGIYCRNNRNGHKLVYNIYVVGIHIVFSAVELGVTQRLFKSTVHFLWMIHGPCGTVHIVGEILFNLFYGVEFVKKHMTKYCSLTYFFS